MKRFEQATEKAVTIYITGHTHKINVTLQLILVVAGVFDLNFLQSIVYIGEIAFTVKMHLQPCSHNCDRWRQHRPIFV